jgi:hypothetical protein
VFLREGSQQGAAKGYNPRRPGRNSHHPILAVMAKTPFVLHTWLRLWNTGAGRDVVEFLKEALKLFPVGMRIRCVRADSVFFDQKLLGFLEELGLAYIVVARLGAPLKGMLSGIQKWTVAVAGSRTVDPVFFKKPRPCCHRFFFRRSNRGSTPAWAAPQGGRQPHRGTARCFHARHAVGKRVRSWIGRPRCPRGIRFTTRTVAHLKSSVHWKARRLGMPLWPPWMAFETRLPVFAYGPSCRWPRPTGGPEPNRTLRVDTAPWISYRTMRSSKLPSGINNQPTPCIP